ncbi:hypothetical protein DL95DRAFT_459137 [Leptodontidium sp. 2 PMI_412]|nr:hypothetical protein DL95DRAFT_459137 [Leptodontidium sp. 2 PMI_412]
MRKGKYFVRPDASQERPLSKRVKQKKEIRQIRTVIEITLEERVFSRLDDATQHFSPFALGHVWSICRMLLNLSRQLGYARGAFVARFLHSLHLSLDLDNQSTAWDLLMLSNISSTISLTIVGMRTKPARSTIGSETTTERLGTKAGGKRIQGSKITRTMASREGTRMRAFGARSRRITLRRRDMLEDPERSETTGNQGKAFSSRRKPTDPNVLRIWADYCRQWDTNALDTQEFLKGYREACRETELPYGPDHDYTIDVLCNYAAAAYYSCHAKDLAYTLATELWKRT